MLLRNMSKITLQTRVKGKMIQLPPNRVVNVDELLISAKQVKDIWGKYVQVLTEKTKEVGNAEKVPTGTKVDLEDIKGEGNVPNVDEAGANEDIANEDAGNANDTENIADENNDTDDGDLNKMVDDILGEDEEKVSGEGKEAAKKEVKAAKKTSKRGKNTKK